MLPIILIAAAAALITACESSSLSKPKAKRSFPPMKEKYTGLDLEGSSYEEEPKAKKFMKKMRPGGDGSKKTSPEKPRPIGGSSSAKPPPIGDWKKKCTDDGHRIESRILEGQTWSSLACVSSSGKVCSINSYFDGQCKLD